MMWTLRFKQQGRKRTLHVWFFVFVAALKMHTKYHDFTLLIFWPIRELVILDL